ncbi:15388_t:CDS:2, partial [Racocetra fulgida]
ERKAAHQAEVNKVKQAEKERKEAVEWSIGAKDSAKKESQKLKREAQLAKKNEAARLLEQEETELSKYKPVLKLTNKSGEEKKAIKRTQVQEQASAERRVIPEFSASNIDDAIDLMTVVTSSSTAVGSAPGQAGGIERHPEKRFKAALAAYEEREMPRVKEEHP